MSWFRLVALIVTFFVVSVLIGTFVGPVTQLMFFPVAMCVSLFLVRTGRLSRS